MKQKINYLRFATLIGLLFFVLSSMQEDNNPQAWQELVKRNPAATSPTGQPVKDLVEKLKTNMKP